MFTCHEILILFCSHARDRYSHHRIYTFSRHVIDIHIIVYIFFSCYFFTFSHLFFHSSSSQFLIKKSFFNNLYVSSTSVKLNCLYIELEILAIVNSNLVSKIRFNFFCFASRCNLCHWSLFTLCQRFVYKQHQSNRVNMFTSSNQTSFEISIKIKFSTFAVSQILIYAINNYMSVVHLTKTSKNVSTNMTSRKMTWLTIEHQLATLKRVMFASETSNRIKKTMQNKFKIENKYFFFVAKTTILKIDIYCKIMQIVFHVIIKNEIDISTWRFVYVSDNLNNAIIKEYIFMLRISNIYRDLYESSRIQSSTTKNFGLLRISLVLIEKNQIYRDVMHYINLIELKIINRFSYVICMFEAFSASNRFTKTQNWTTDVVYKQHQFKFE